MWNLESYRDILNENNRHHHTIGSWLVVLLVIGVLIFVFA
jgi:hypothetical protein